MKKLVLFGVLVLAALLVFSFTPAQAQAPMKLKTCWMPEQETFFPWLAKQKGWDKQEGLDLELLFFDSGMAQMEALKRYRRDGEQKVTVQRWTPMR